MNNKIIRKLIVLLIMFLMLASITMSYSNAFVAISFNEFENSSSVSSDVTNPIKGMSGTVLEILRVVSVAIAIVMLLVIAMRYMLSAPGDRADLKKHAVAYVVGAFVLFGLTGILSILVGIAEQIK